MPDSHQDRQRDGRPALKDPGLGQVMNEAGIVRMVMRVELQGCRGVLIGFGEPPLVHAQHEQVVLRRAS
jgi:hypothetical protein